MQKHIFALGLTLVMFTACTKPSQHIYYLEGVVLDDSDSSPIAGARISAVRSSSGWFSSTISSDTVTTDEFGVFFIQLPQSTDFLGGAYTVDPTHMHIEHPDYCPPIGESFLVNAESAPTTQLVYRVKPMAYGKVIATNTGAYTGAFDAISITTIGQVSLEAGTVTDGDVFRSCYQLDNTVIFVDYRLGDDLVHRETHTVELMRKDTLVININY